MAVRMVATAATVVATEEVTAAAGMEVVTGAEMAMVVVMVGMTADTVGTEAVAMAATDTTDMAVVVVVVATAVASWCTITHILSGMYSVRYASITSHLRCCTYLLVLYSCL